MPFYSCTGGERIRGRNCLCCNCVSALLRAGTRSGMGCVLGVDHVFGALRCCYDVWAGGLWVLGLLCGWGVGGGMRRKRHQTRSKIINRLSAEH